MNLGVLQETYPGERRVGLVPASVAALKKSGHEVLVEPGAGIAAGFPDAEYLDKGAKLAASADEVWKNAQIVVQVRTLGANPQAGQADLPRMRTAQVVVGMADP